MTHFMEQIGLYILSATLTLSPVGEAVDNYDRDLARLTTESYDTVFFSMYPTAHYEEEDYSYFRAMDIVKGELCIPGSNTLGIYMDTAMHSENQVSTIYLGISPQQMDGACICSILDTYPDTMFEIALSYPEIIYWQGLSTAEYEGALQAYKDFCSQVIPYDNARVQLFGSAEWLICNPANYTEDGDTNPEVSRILMANTDGSHGYALTADTMDNSLEDMKALLDDYRTHAPVYPDLQGTDIVFIGDSIFGEYRDSMSVPGVVAGLTGARVFNLGVGGMSATEQNGNPLSLTALLNSLTEQDTSYLPEGCSILQDVNDFLYRPDDAGDTVFILNFGLNDYFGGLPVGSGDSQGTASYSGALRNAVSRLQKAFPGSRIIVNTPNFTVYYENGKEVMSPQGGILTDYVAAAQGLSQIPGVTVFDSYREIPVDPEHFQVYLTDGCHLNEQGRFLLGSRLASLLSE